MFYGLHLLLVVWLAIGSAFGFVGRDPAGATIAVAELPPEARQTLARIKSSGPFPYRRDGIVFGNYERRLPLQARGYYREYTVPTPGRRDRGPRRIVAGKTEYYYTEDHYQSFRLILE